MIDDFVSKQDLMFFTSAGRFMTAAVYVQAGEENTLATFDLFIRDLPPCRNYLVFCGLEHIADYLLNFLFTREQLDFVIKMVGKKPKAIEYFRKLRFTGDMWAMPEGTICFPNEPVIRITAPIAQCALLEQYLINTVMLQTMLASKLARVVHAAGPSPIGITFVRTHGVDAAVKSVRVGNIVGIDQVGLTISAMKYGIMPTGGFTYHHFFQAFDSEKQAFENYAKYYPGKGWILIDTFDNMRGIKNIIEVSREYGPNAFKGIILDSGDVLRLSKIARKMLDQAGLSNIKITIMGNLEEYKINELIKSRAPVDLYGLATEVLTSADAPKLEVVYKLSEVVRNGKAMPKMKLSSQKISLPGRKQVFRAMNNSGKYVYDIIGLENEQISGKKLLIPIIKQGKLAYKFPTIQQIHNYYKTEADKFPERLFSIDRRVKYQVKISSGLRKLTRETRKAIEQE